MDSGGLWYNEYNTNLPGHHRDSGDGRGRRRTADASLDPYPPIPSTPGTSVKQGQTLPLAPPTMSSTASPSAPPIPGAPAYRCSSITVLSLPATTASPRTPPSLTWWATSSTATATGRAAMRISGSLRWPFPRGSPMRAATTTPSTLPRPLPSLKTRQVPASMSHGVWGGRTRYGSYLDRPGLLALRCPGRGHRLHQRGHPEKRHQHVRGAP